MAIGATTGATASNGSASSTLAFAAFAATGGQDLVVGVALADTMQTVTGITDTAGNAYSLKSAIANGTDVRTEIWEATNITANAANVITIAFSGSTLASAA